MFKGIEELINKILETLINNQATITSVSELQFNSTVLAYASKIWNYFMIIGIGMTLIYFLMEMNRKLAFEGRDLNLKSMFAPFLKLMAAIAVLSQGANIVSWLLGFHNKLIQQAFSGDTFKADVADIATGDAAGLGDVATIIGTDGVGGIGEVFTQLHLGIGVKLTILVIFLLTWLVALICGLVWSYKALTYKIEFLFRISITPIALADIYSGQHSNAIRWFKGILGTTLFGFSMLIIPRIGGLISYSFIMDITTEFYDIVGDGVGEAVGGTISVLWNMIKGILGLLVVPIAELGCLSAIKQLTKEVLG